MIGVMLLEANFLGRGIGVFGGLFYQDLRLMGMLGLFSEHFGLSAGYIDTEVEEYSLKDYSKRRVRQYDTVNTSFSISPNFNNGNWTLSIPFQYESFSVSESSSDPGLMDGKSENLFETGMTVAFSNLYRKKYFSEGASVEVTGIYILPVHSYFSMHGSYSSVLGLNKLEISSNSGWGDFPVTKRFNLGGEAGGLTLPSGVSSDMYCNAVFKYERILFDFKQFDLSTSVFYETGIFHDILDESILYHGPGIDASLYLDRIAIPAINISYSWSAPLKESFISFSLGMSF